MAKAVKGIRVNQLAKELGVPSKQILERCKAEDLGNLSNHMSLMPFGLADTVRGWFVGEGGVATAVETEAEEATEAKPKPARRRGKKAEEPIKEAEAPTDQAPAAEAPAVDAPEAPAEPSTEPTSEAGAEPEAPAVDVPPVVAEDSTPAVAVDAPVEPPAVVETSESPETPVADTPSTPMPPSAPPAAPVAPTVPDLQRPLRPTVSLANRSGPTQEPIRKTVTPAPQLLKPQPAVLRGPVVVREEKPDVVAAPRRRPQPGEGSGGGPTFVQARTQGGRGVKAADEESEEEKKKKGRTLSARRRGPDGRRGEAMEKLREYSEADLEERRIRLGNAGHARTLFDSHLDKLGRRGMHGPSKTIVQKGDPVEIIEPVTIKALSAALGVKSNDIIKNLMRQGIMANINQALDSETAEALALDYGIELKIKGQPSLEEQLEEQMAAASSPEDLVIRPPVVTILGHVDHGKTSLLDKIRQANVAEGEAGGITQHTAAWMVQLGEKRVTFIDTPGHQAFTSMRARGANMTDVVVLVVSAAEGVQPQTVESINHARAADVPIVVAMNKIDRADANEQQVLGQLAANGLNPVEWGGDTEVIRTSAMTGQGIPELIEILDYQSALLELKANPTAPARGRVIESRMDEGLGAVATVLVQDGTLRVGDIILSGPGYGRIRSLLNDRLEPIQEAGPAMPVLVSGLNILPGAGDKFHVVGDLDQARTIAEERQVQARQAQLAGQNKVTSANLIQTMTANLSKTINLIIKGDVQGSVETLVKTVTEQNTNEVKVRVIHYGVGPISESDVELAIATKTKPTDNRVGIIGFHVVPEESARALAEQNHVDVKLYRVIYEIFDDLKKALSGMLEPEIREKLHGHVEIRQVFKVSRMGNIAGCMVTDGHVQRGSKIRLIRNGAVITEDLSLESLKRMKDDVREVKSGFECGIKIAGYDDIKVGDVLEAYSREKHERTL